MQRFKFLRKNKKLEWTEKHEDAPKALKGYLYSAPALMNPVVGEPLSLYLAVSDAEVRTNYPIKNVLRKPEVLGSMAKWAVKLSAYDVQYEPRTSIKSLALADFVADSNIALQKEADLKVQQLEETKDPWILFTDGESNVRGKRLGILLKSPQGDIQPQYIACEFQATNNEAEYEALILGLLLVPREENDVEYALANLASSLKIPDDIKISFIYFLNPLRNKK
ncbi:uncharacterized protein LOC143567775 [Bidens hawaiensis]|uniref:uncharacterized protein LOC143567775 n=1 Tax=Bidens hawaiensis TaxID=980011 RepID=UPI004049E196